MYTCIQVIENEESYWKWGLHISYGADWESIVYVWRNSIRNRAQGKGWWIIKEKGVKH